MEDLEEVLARSESKDGLSAAGQTGTPSKDSGAPGVVTAAALASKSRKGGKKGGKKMVVACYADDAKEPELIGECQVPIEDVLKKGEVDGECRWQQELITEWYEFLHKDKYSGEVYLELTFYSNVSARRRRAHGRMHLRSSVMLPYKSTVRPACLGQPRLRYRADLRSAVWRLRAAWAV
jgi:hypothetical protein